MKKILSTDQFDNWLFIKRENTPYAWSSSKELPITLEGQTELKSAILNLIDNAQECIKLCTFILTDYEIVKALLKKIESSDIALFILTQLDSSKFSASLLTEEEIIDNSEETHLKAINSLHNNGAHIRASENVHAKFIIADNKTTLLTSANITTPSLNINPESGVFLDRRASDIAAKLFDLIYRYGTTYNQFVKTGSGKKFIAHTNFSLSKDLLPTNQEGFLYTLGDLNHTLYENLIDLIDEANKIVTISSYCVIGLENLPEFTNAIQHAIKRGVEIKLFCRGMNYRTDHLLGCTKLAELGCKIYGDIFNHSKGLSNENRGIIFTANLDGRHGLKSGFEVGANLNYNQSISLNTFMNWQIQNSNYEFMKCTQRKKYFDTYEWYAKIKGAKCPPRFDSLLIHAIGLDQSQKQALENSPFYGLYESNELKAIDLNGTILIVTIENGSIRVKATKKKYWGIEKYLIRYNELNLQYE